MQRRRPIPHWAGARPFPLPWLILAAAIYAAAEIGAALLFGFHLWGRAEALLFLAFRPFLLLLAASLVARYRLVHRIGFYGLALALAAASETLLLLKIGATDPWPQMLRGLLGGAALLAVFDLILQLGQRLHRRWGRPVLTALMALLLLTPRGLSGYDAALLSGQGNRQQSAQRPDLMLMTALPIVWGETGAFDPSSRPAAAYTALQREYKVRPLDVLSPESLASGRLLLLAQPRALAPEELVALDDWVRKGGRALILSDPTLVWPTDLPLGDPRRPPAIGLLGPILTHWGIQMEAPEQRAVVVRDRSGRRLALGAPGSVRTTNPLCRVEPDRYLARCRIGEGEAIVLADADLLQDALWVAPGESGERRHRRTSDNPLVVADLLDQLAGIERGRLEADVQWARQDAPREAALLIAALPLLLALAAALLLALRLRRHA
jgi:hypothetical protein